MIRKSRLILSFCLDRFKVYLVVGLVDLLIFLTAAGSDCGSVCVRL